MPDLSGSLSNFEIASLVRFLSGLGKSGDLLLSREHWIGQLSIERGLLIAAATDDDLGRPALEFIAAIMGSGDFEFSEGPPTLAANLDLNSDPLADFERIRAGEPQTWARRLLPPTVVPRVNESAAPDDGEVTLGRMAIFVLRDVDGVRTVRDIGARHGLLRTLRALTRLHELDLIAFEAGPPAPHRDMRTNGPQARPPQTPSAQSVHQASALPPPAPPAAQGPRARNMPWAGRFSRERTRNVATELGQAILVTGLFVFGIHSVVQNFRVEGISMVPTFVGGQALVVNRAAYLHVENSPLAHILPTTGQGSISYIFGGPQRGDVAVFRAPPQPDADYIKRIIGLPGESILIRSGQVFINGHRLDEAYVDHLATYDFPPDGQPIIVPDGNYFVLGDNRPESFDSHLGWFVPADNLIGRAWLRYWPPDEIGVVQSDRGPSRAT